MRAYHRPAMYGRTSPARFLAPLALAAVVIAIIVVVGSVGGENGSADSPSGGTGTSQTQKTSSGKKRKAPSKSYTVKAGDTLAQIALKTGITSDRLLILNPDLDPNAIQVGQKIKLRP